MSAILDVLLNLVLLAEGFKDLLNQVFFLGRDNHFIFFLLPLHWPFLGTDLLTLFIGADIQ